jgi:16S rRNA (guanine527-N7)-methyltransferase
VKHRRGYVASSDERAWTLSFIGADSRIEARLDAYVNLVARWRGATNLISESTFSHIWTRHIADCAQLLTYAPLGRRWVDLGSGAGFPGLIIAIQLAGIQGVEIHCIESDKRKCAFLREVARATGVAVHIHAMRIEALSLAMRLPVDVVTSRALAPLPRLIGFARLWLGLGAVGIFPRGRAAALEIDELSLLSEFQYECFPSRLDPHARIVRIQERQQV